MASPPGLGSHAVFLTERGGAGTLGTPVRFSSLSYARLLDDTTVCKAVVPTDRFDADPLPWDLEVRVDRDNDPNVWVGPLVIADLAPGQTDLEARDVTAWLDHRPLTVDRLFTGVDAAFVARRIVLDALSLDTTPNVSVAAEPSGIFIDALVDAAELEYCGDRLRDLADGPLDFIALGRTIHIGGAGVGVNNTAPVLVVDDAFTDYSATRDGLVYASRQYVRGAGNAVGVADLPGATSGVVATVDRDDTLLSNAEAEQGARTRLLVAGSRGWTIRGNVGQKCPIPFARLVPGLAVDVRLDGLPWPIRQASVLTEVTVEVDENNGETIGVVIEPADVVEGVLG